MKNNNGPTWQTPPSKFSFSLPFEIYVFPFQKAAYAVFSFCPCTAAAALLGDDTDP